MADRTAKEKLRIHYDDLFPISEFQMFPNIDKHKLSTVYFELFKDVDRDKSIFILSEEPLYRSVFYYLFSSHPRILSYFFKNGYFYLDTAYGNISEYPTLFSLPKKEVYCSFLDTNGIKNKEYDTIFAKQFIPLYDSAIHWVFGIGREDSFKRNFPKTYQHFNMLYLSGGGSFIKLPLNLCGSVNQYDEDVIYNNKTSNIGEEPSFERERSNYPKRKVNKYKKRNYSSYRQPVEEITSIDEVDDGDF